MVHYIEFRELLGKTLSSIDNNGDRIIYKTVDGEEYHSYHCQECCESVTVDDVVGDLEDSVGSPILLAEEVSSCNEDEDRPSGYCDSWTWTFYKLSTINGHVTIKWLDTSNGYYSESVSFVKVSN